jgi:bacteriocin biosynthesis cyclodehydratase domain-containing protein
MMLILTAGDFGRDVGQLLARTAGAQVHDLLEALPRLDELAAGHAFIGVATWRPYEAACEQIDDWCHANGVRWSLAQLAGASVALGPLVVPGQKGGACFHCAQARRRTHRKGADRERVLEAAYARDDALGIPGHPRAQVLTAAEALREDAGAPAREAGRTRGVDSLTAAVLESSVVALHDCPRCRPLPAGHDATRRGVEVMVPVLEGIL